MIRLFQPLCGVFQLRLLYTIIVCILPYYLYAQKEVTDNEQKFLIYFKINSSEIVPSYLSNKTTLEDMDKIMRTNNADLNIKIEVFSSPEGLEATNNILSEKRAESIKRYFSTKYGHTGKFTIETESLGENWNGLLESVLSDNKIPERAELIQILKDQSLDHSQQKNKIKKLDSGKTYAYLTRYQLPKLRLALINIQKTVIANPIVHSQSTLNESTTQNETITQLQDNGTSNDSIIMIADISEYQEYPITTTTPGTLLAIKTNLAAYIFGILNLGVEVPLGKHVSFDLPIYYSPYTLGNAYRFRILATQPEFRYWFGETMKGHFIGLYGTGGWYNISFNKRDRYQDRNGNTPAWGGGLSYGFALPLNQRWGLEFTAGAGYLNLKYDTFYNIKNGAKFDTQRKSYYGLTKLGVSITYNLTK